MSTPTIMEELDWCEVELANIKAGLFSMYTQEYIEGAISALKLAREELCQPFCGDHLVPIRECGCQI
jgi:hypothetical protein